MIRKPDPKSPRYGTVPGIPPRQTNEPWIPREECGSESAYYLCTEDERKAFGLTPPPRRGRHDGWKPECMARFIETLAATASVSAAATSVHKSRASAYRLRNRADGAHFRVAWDEALRSAVGVLATTAFERAVKGVPVAVWYKGEKVGEDIRYNDRLLMYLLRVRAPQGYAPVDEVSRAGLSHTIDAERSISSSLDQIKRIEPTWQDGVGPALGLPAADDLAANAAPAGTFPVPYDDEEEDPVDNDGSAGARDGNP